MYVRGAADDGVLGYRSITATNHIYDTDGPVPLLRHSSECFL